MDESRVDGLNPGDLPLSLSQREVWLDQCALPESTHLNIGGGGFIRGPFVREAFVQALDDLVAENEALRLVPDLGGRQRLLDRWSPGLAVIDATAAGDAEAYLQHWLASHIAEPFALGAAPPWRFALIRFADDLHWLSIQFHHLVMDGWGTVQVMRRWVEWYNARISGQAPPPANDPGYLAFIAESLAYRASPAFADDAAYWLARLPAMPAPLIERRHAPAGRAGVSRAFAVTERVARADYDALGAVLSGLGVSAAALAIAVLALYFARTSGRRQVVIGIPSLNRGGKRYLATPGMFVGVFPLVLDVDPAMTVRALLAAVRAALRDALRHPRYPLSELGRHLQMIRHGRDALFDVVFSFERQDYALRFGDTAVSMGARQVFSGCARYPLGVTLCEFHPEQDVELTVEASADCFEAAEAGCLAQRLVHLFVTLGRAPDIPLDAIDLLPATERTALRDAPFQQHADIAPLTCLARFEGHCGRAPDALALCWDGGSMSYAALDAHADRIADALLRAGVGPSSIVGVALERSPEMVAALVAVWRVGAAFLPLDVDAPVARLSAILADAAATAVLIQSWNRPHLGDVHTRIVAVDALGVQATPVARVTVAADDLAYVLFTSGSTGAPKGVMVDHGALARRIDWLARTWGVTAADRSGQLTQLTFDPSLIEIMLPLSCGGSVALAPPGRQHPVAAGEFACRHAATLMALVPATVRGIADFAETRPGALRLRVACCGGEVLPPDLAAQFLRTTGAVLYNVYGPTEATIFATAWPCQVDTDTPVLPVGYPVAATEIRVLDERGQVVPFGVAGEVAIGGAGLARGYLNRVDLTAERFFSDPLRSGARLYRTGDRGWLGCDGNLHFLGRLDRQVKLRGYRIEPGEIEAALASLPGVRQAAVRAAALAEGRMVLYAWVAATDGVLARSLRDALSALLPDYMLPAGIAVLPALPVNSSGKLDYAALPAPVLAAEHVPARLPSGRHECGVLAIWQSALKRQDIGLRDNFFDLGGDSLSAVDVLAGIERDFGRRLTLYRLVENPTVEQLAAELAGAVSANPVLVPLNRQPGRPVLYLAASGHGDLLRFQSLASALGDACDFTMLQPPPETAFADVGELARRYADAIAEAGRPGFVAGFSVGGVTALETARLLAGRGMPLPGVILVDTVFPGRVLRGALFWRLLGWAARYLRFEELSMNGRHLGAMFSDAGLAAQINAVSRYRPAVFDEARVHLLTSTGLGHWERWVFRPWGQVVRRPGLQVRVPGLHGSIFEQGNVGALAAALLRILGDAGVDDGG